MYAIFIGKGRKWALGMPNIALYWAQIEGPPFDLDAVSPCDLVYARDRKVRVCAAEEKPEIQRRTHSRLPSLAPIAD